jgi:hypothetical protein
MEQSVFSENATNKKRFILLTNVNFFFFFLDILFVFLLDILFGQLSKFESSEVLSDDYA